MTGNQLARAGRCSRYLVAALPSATCSARKCGAFFTRHRLIDIQQAAVQRFAVHRGDSLLHAFSAFHRYKGKATRAACTAIHWEMNIGNQTVLFASGPKIRLRSVEGKIPDVYFGVHDLGLREQSAFFDCSRSPSFKPPPDQYLPSDYHVLNCTGELTIQCINLKDQNTRPFYEAAKVGNTLSRYKPAISNRYERSDG